MVIGPWPGITWSTSSAAIRSSAATHWSMSEVMSHVCTSEKTVSPVKTTRSSGTWTANCPGVWPGVWINSTVWSPTRSVTSPVKTMRPVFMSAS